MTERQEVILDIGAEGGGLKLLGRKTADGPWEYQAVMRDRILSMVEGISGGAIDRATGWTASWDDAIRALDRYPWALLAVITVHAEFRERVYAEAMKRLAEAPERIATLRKDRWRETCGVRSADGEYDYE